MNLFTRGSCFTNYAMLIICTMYRIIKESCTQVKKKSGTKTKGHHCFHLGTLRQNVDIRHCGVMRFIFPNSSVHSHIQDHDHSIHHSVHNHNQVHIHVRSRGRDQPMVRLRVRVQLQLPFSCVPTVHIHIHDHSIQDHDRSIHHKDRIHVHSRGRDQQMVRQQQ